MDLYTYGQYSLLENNISMHYDEKQDILTISDYYNRGHTATKGTCSELANFHALLEKSSFEQVFIAGCHETQYFSKGAHFSVVGSETSYRLKPSGTTDEKNVSVGNEENVSR